ncbi:jg22715 [Pararge aegeria aegeria]|uniref:Jg22715 protein n=1 Tax=Pararge aegeria aegeria TaxID=348720 RepID=A0A8S4QJJ2_9NEOP|nr:jg22715 [Pararge aegeria aegeria]
MRNTTNQKKTEVQKNMRDTGLIEDDPSSSLCASSLLEVGRQFHAYDIGPYFFERFSVTPGFWRRPGVF